MKRKTSDVMKPTRPLSSPLFSVFVDAREASRDDVSATLASLDGQSYRNVEVILQLPEAEDRLRTNLQPGN